MGLFDFFKKGEPKQNGEHKFEGTVLYTTLGKYKDYLMIFAKLSLSNNYAPIAAFENENGEVEGLIYFEDEKSAYTSSIQEGLLKLEQDLEDLFLTKKANSYIIFYNSQFDLNDNHAIATNNEELKGITLNYKLKDSTSGKLGVKINKDNDGFSLTTIKEFSETENTDFFNPTLKENYEYFQNKKNVSAPELENEIGLKIIKSNTQTLSDMWCGIFGFENYRNNGGNVILKQHVNLSLDCGELIQHNHEIIGAYLKYDDVNFKSVILNNEFFSVIPIINTDKKIDIVTHTINEWEHMNNYEAIVTGHGRNTFMISYFATDYAENRGKYLSKKDYEVQLSGIVFVLDISNVEDKEDIKYSKDFTMYIPSNDLYNYACFDFIGELESFKKTNLLEDDSLNSYILTVRLITNPDFKDFFTIDMYVTEENMRFKELHTGMKLTGMFQLQGKLA